MLNIALFGMTAKQWRDTNPDKKGNIQDYSSINELICLSDMENINAVLIEDGLSQKERLIKLNKIAIHQISILEEQTTKIKWLIYCSVFPFAPFLKQVSELLGSFSSDEIETCARIVMSLTRALDADRQ